MFLLSKVEPSAHIFMSFWPDFVSNRWIRNLSTQLMITLLVWLLSKLLLLQKSTLPSLPMNNSWNLITKLQITSNNISKLQRMCHKNGCSEDQPKIIKAKNDISNVIYLQYTYCMWYCEKIRYRIMWQISTYFERGITELGTYHTQEHNYTNTLIQFTQFLQI